MNDEKNNQQRKKSKSLKKENKSEEEKNKRSRSIKERKKNRSKSNKSEKSENKIKKQKKEKSKEKKLKKSLSKEKIKKEKKPAPEKDDKEDLSSENIIVQENDLYSLLGLKRNATNLEIRKAYKRLVLLCHPDKNKTDPDTASKFMNITRAYKILSNENSRKYYDETGEYEEEDQGQIDIDNTLNFFRKIYSPQDIDSYVNKYVGSKEEEQDLINYYNDNNGDLRRILEWIPCSKNEDVERFIDIYEKLFKEKILKKNQKYEKTKNNINLIKEIEDEKEEAEETLDKLTKQIMINKKKRNYNDYLQGLANKFGDGEKMEDNEISEEEFQKISNRLNKGKKKKNKKK